MDSNLQKERVRQYFDQSEQWQKELYADQGHPFNRVLTRNVEYAFAMLDKVSNLKSGVALDIGCGPGAYIEQLMKRGFDTYGADISEEMLNACKMRLHLSNEHFRTHFIRSDIDQLPFDDNSVDLIVCVGVMGNLLSDEQALSEISRVLKPGGYLLLGHENMMSLSNLDFVLRWKIRSLVYNGLRRQPSQYIGNQDDGVTMPSSWYPGEKGTFWKLYNPWKVEALMKKKGFSLVDSCSVGHEFRILRRFRFVPESLLSSIEVSMDKNFRNYHTPYFRYSGQFYLAIFQKS
jgi:ubiquinone/menaquinone biosynthesis C-methylase UbiE